MRKKALVSIIIVIYNGMKYLKKCLESVLRNDYPFFEVIVVDNASNDGSWESAKKFSRFDKRVKVVRNERNYGHPGGCNIGASIAKGDYLVFLDVDTVVTRKWLTELIKSIETDPKIGIVQSKLLQMNNPSLIDSVGCSIDFLGYAYEDERGEMEKYYKEKREFFHANSASIIIRKKLYLYFLKNGLELFNNDFFMYYDDTELSWKVRLLGYKIILCPTSIVYHARGILSFRTANPHIIFHLTKNRLITLIENYRIFNLLKYLPFTVFLEIGRAFIILPINPRQSFWIIKGVLWTFLNIGKIWKKRTRIQKIRKVSDLQLMKLMKRPSLTLLLRSFKEKYSKSNWRSPHNPS